MGTKYKGSPKEVSALNIFIKLSRCVESVMSELSPTLSKAGLTVSQFGIMESIYHLGPMCQKELASKILKSGGNITLVVDNLAKQGYVKRIRSEQDRRYSTVHLTAAGRRKISALFPKIVEKIVERMGTLTQKEQKAIGPILKKLGEGHK
ncbi:hypothetical protein MNBD_NITROSPINAE01-1846 [hydrothermal vent metagenome]|uniref:HTH marR-type domain-containing protein n=1 Tax=hydrothermal vent metagenome TaxID=652676 RepID=A0A3B1BTD2_9ZZZZ